MKNHSIFWFVIYLVLLLTAGYLFILTFVFWFVGLGYLPLIFLILAGTGTVLAMRRI